MESIEQITSLLPRVMLAFFAILFYKSWRSDRHEERQLRERDRQDQIKLRKQEIETRHAIEKLEEERKSKQADEDNTSRYWKERREEEDEIREKAGAASGGFIVINIEESQRSMFQDLLKGFEEYARLKGYSVAFSVDNTFSGRVAFKFTLTDADVVVVNDKVRKDLKEYIEKVKTGSPLDDMPTIISLEEHDLLVTSLKNRISFLQNNYNLAKNSSDFYENLVRKFSDQPLLPSPNVFVQTGGHHNAPNYIAQQSPQATLGNGNQTKNIIRIAATFKEKREQIEKIAELIENINNEVKDDNSLMATRNLINIKDELETEENPDQNRLIKWLGNVTQALQAGSFGHETVAAARELIRLFGNG